VTQIILRLIVAHREKIVPRATAQRRIASGVHRQQVQLIANHLRLRVHDDVHVARAQSTPSPEKTKRKTSGQLKAIDQHVPALRKQLLDSLLSRRMMRYVTEIRQQALRVLLTSLLNIVASWATRLDQYRERRQNSLRVAQRHNYGRRFGRENVIRETG
jgi:hypothetical protein